MDALGISLDVEDGLAELGLHGVHGFERVVLEDLFADFVPKIFFRIEFRRIGREKQERDVAGTDEVATVVVIRPDLLNHAIKEIAFDWDFNNCAISAACSKRNTAFRRARFAPPG